MARLTVEGRAYDACQATKVSNGWHMLTKGELVPSRLRGTDEVQDRSSRICSLVRYVQFSALRRPTSLSSEAALRSIAYRFSVDSSSRECRESKPADTEDNRK